MPQKESLAYHLPPVGTTRVHLHDESAELYRFLVVSGESGRLEKLDHLGLVRVGWSGAHHPRWEYVLTILRLIEACKPLSAVHLSARVTLPDGVRVSSGSELLKSWALLANLGHLHETFSAERALLFEVARSRSGIRNELLRPFERDERLLRWAARVIRELRVYSFFQIVSYVRLEELAAATGIAPESLNRWQAMLDSYVLPDPPARPLSDLRRIYRNIRRLAYVGLDSHYLPAVMNIDLRELPADEEALTRLVLFDDRSNIESDDLRALEHYLYREFYLGERVLLAVAARETRLRSLVRERLQTVGLRATIEDLAQNRLQESIVTENISRVIRLTGWRGGDLGDAFLPQINVMGKQRVSDQWVGVRDQGVRLTWWEAAYGGEWVMQIHAPPNDLSARVTALGYAFDEAVAIADTMVDEWSDFAPREALHSVTTERHAAELIRAAISTMFGADLRWEWAARRGEPVAYLSSRVWARQELAAQAARVTTSQARSDEIEGLRRQLRRRPLDPVAVAAVNMLAYEGTAGSPLLELDGVALEFVGSTLRLTITETKRMRRGAKGAATRELREKLGRLSARPSVRVSRIEADQDQHVCHASVVIEGDGS